MRFVIALTLLSTYTSPLLARDVEDFPAILKCRSLGSWECSPDKICIDNERGRGNYYIFSTKKMSYHSSMIGGKIASIGGSPTGLKTLTLDDGRVLTLDFKKVGTISSSSLGSSETFEELNCNDH